LAGEGGSEERSWKAWGIRVRERAAEREECEGYGGGSVEVGEFG